MKRSLVVVRPTETALLLLLVVGCGVTKTAGPNTPVSIVSSGETPSTPKSLLSLSGVQPSSISSRNLPLTIVLSGTGFTTESLALWNGKPLPTIFRDTNTLITTAPSRLLITPGVAHIAVGFPLDPTRVTDALRFSVFPETGPRISILDVTANDLAWDSANGRIYLAIANRAASTGMVSGINPSTLETEVSSPVTGQPSLLSVSSAGKYLYVAFEGSTAIARKDLPNLADDGTIEAMSDSAYIAGYTSDLESSPLLDSTVAVARMITGMDYFERTEVSVFDDLVWRPAVLCGSFQSSCSNRAQGLFDEIQWGNAGEYLYLGDDEPSGLVFFSAPVTDKGVLSPTVHYTNSPASLGSRLHNDGTSQLVYTDAGAVIDPVTGETVGNFPAAGRMVAEGLHGMAYFIVQSPQPNFSTRYLLEGFDLHTFTPVCSMKLPDLKGIPDRLIGWGNAGFAFNTVSTNADSKGSNVYIVDDEGDCKNWPSFGQGS